MSQNYRYPSSAQVTVTAVGTNGSPIPTTSILVAGENPSLNLKPLQTDSSGNLKIVGTATLGGKTAVGLVRNAYASVNVTTSAYVQLIASTAAAVSEIYIFDSSGQTLVLATGGVGVEVDQIYITPGGNGTVPISIAAGTRISIKAVSNNATAGEIDINLFG